VHQVTCRLSLVYGRTQCFERFNRHH
jgi:hypothetical protein